RIDTRVLTRQSPAHRSAPLRHGALDIAIAQRYTLDVSARRSPHPGVSLHASTEPMAERLWPCGLSSLSRRDPSRGRRARLLLCSRAGASRTSFTAAVPAALPR